MSGSLNKRCGLFSLGKKARQVYSVVGKSANLNILMASHLKRTFLEKQAGQIFIFSPILFLQRQLTKINAV